MTKNGDVHNKNPITSPSPRGVPRWLLLLPVWLYRHRLGWLLGSWFLLLTHCGRKTGRLYKTAVEVVDHMESTETYVVASGWGEESDWYRNVLNHPVVVIQVGRKKFAARGRHLPKDDAEQALSHYASRHPLAFRELSMRLTGERLRGTAIDCRRLAASVPLIAFDRI